MSKAKLLFPPPCPHQSSVPFSNVSCLLLSVGHRLLPVGELSVRGKPSIAVGSNLTQQEGTSSQPKQRDFDSFDVFIIFLVQKCCHSRVGGRMLLVTWKRKQGVRSAKELSADN